MRAGATFPKALLFREKVDFRKWIKGLVALIEQEYRLSPFEDCLFIFVVHRHISPHGALRTN